jgi:hypothetical protein
MAHTVSRSARGFDVRLLIAWTSGLFTRLTAAMAPPACLSKASGVRIVHLGSEDGAPADLAAAGAALALLAVTSPRAVARLRRDVPRVALTTLHGLAGGYSYGTGWVLLDVEYLRTHQPGCVAALLVHEATHARIRRMGAITLRGRAERVERRCVREQAAFAETLPVGVGVCDQCAAAIARGTAGGWWAPDREGERRAAGARELGAPRWLVERVRRFGRWMARGAT